MPATKCRTKYHTTGLSESSTFVNIGVNEKYTKLLSDAVNLALTDNTKSQYKTAIKHIERIEKELGIDMSLPFTIDKTLSA